MNKISIIIPCIPQHFNEFLLNLINDIISSTRIPNEIIISLCDCLKIEKKYFDEFKNKLYFLFNDKNKITKKNNKQIINCKYKIVTNNELLFAGENRNYGFSYSTGNIIIFQDADDYIHNQKIEIIEYFFDKYKDVVCINHCFIGKLPKYKFVTYDNFDKIGIYFSDIVFKKHFPNNSINDKYKLWYGTHSFGIDVANGHVSIKRCVMEKIKFTNKKRGQDRIFLYDVLYEFKKSIIIDAKLIKYTNW